MAPVHRTFQEVFGKDRVHPYIVHIPSFTDNYGMFISTSKHFARSALAISIDAAFFLSVLDWILL